MRKVYYHNIGIFTRHCSSQVLNLKTYVIRVAVQERGGRQIMGGQMARSPGYYLHRYLSHSYLLSQYQQWQTAVIHCIGYGAVSL